MNKTRLEQGIVLKDLATYSNAPDFIEHTTRLYKDYPELVEKIFLKMFTMDGEPAKKMIWKMLPIVREVSMFNLIKDGMKGVGAI